MAESNNAGASREPRYAYYADDEISLIDLWRILVSRKTLIIIVFIVCTVAGVVVGYAIDEEFEARATIQIGVVSIPGGAATMNSMRLENPEEMSARIKQAFDADPDTGVYLKEVSTGRRGAEAVLTLVARGPDAEASVRYLQSALDRILSEHQERYASRVDRERAYLAGLSSHIVSLEESLDELSGKSAASPAMSTQDRLELERLKVQLLELKGNYADRETLIMPPYSEPTEVLGRPGDTVSKVKPKPALYVALSLLLGGMLGIFAAFFAEFLKNARTSTS